MEDYISKIKENWREEGVQLSVPATNENVSFFSLSNNILLPPDLVEYFVKLNGTSDGYDGRLFKFYPLSQFKTIKNELGAWGGVPDYRNLVKRLNDHEHCYVFADYSFHLLSYAVRLYPYSSTINEIYVLCGEEFKIIANSFTEFVSLYLDDDPKLYFS